MWLHVARAVEALRPCLVVIENVRGLLTSPAGSPGDVEPCPWCLGDTAGQPAVRALGAVLGSLADLRFDARWCVLRAS
ncbi:C-5 cytosine-specific DNA methylase, partial [Streptomyces sp. NPDC057271]